MLNGIEQAWAGVERRRRTSILAKATGTHYGTKTPSVLLYKTACREKVNYRGRSAFVESDIDFSSHR